MYSKTITVVNSTGLHARPASVMTLCAKRFSSSITLKLANDAESEPVNAKSVLRVLSTAISKGDVIEISADGADESEAVDTLVSLVSSGFGELGEMPDISGENSVV